MSVIVGYAPIEPIVQRILAPDELVQRQVWEILGGLYPRGKAAERRIDQRFPYPNILYLTPVSSDGISPAGDHVAVVGKHLSEHGVGFYYQQPLPYRKMIASLEMRSQWSGFLIDITWCRFTQHGWYDSGGRFLQAVPSPIQRKVS